MGYYMPKDTAVVPNMWYGNASLCDGSAYKNRMMNRDEDVWDNPGVFRPERFLEMDALDAKANDPTDVVFGYGRR